MSRLEPGRSRADLGDPAGGATRGRRLASGGLVEVLREAEAQALAAEEGFGHPLADVGTGPRVAVAERDETPPAPLRARAFAYATFSST